MDRETFIEKATELSRIYSDLYKENFLCGISNKEIHMTNIAFVKMFCPDGYVELKDYTGVHKIAEIKIGNIRFFALFSYKELMEKIGGKDAKEEG